MQLWIPADTVGSRPVTNAVGERGASALWSRAQAGCSSRDDLGGFK